jgi:hypothetical protein
LDYDAKKNAEYHVDRHMKMLLEGMQLVCTAFHLQGVNAPYKPTHINHPSAIFTRASSENFQFVIDYVEALSEENVFRYGKIHKSSMLLKWVDDNRHLMTFPKVKMTEFALAMPEKYKDSDAVKAYRKYYVGEKQHIFNWKNRRTPGWIKILEEIG